jgi:hypothetical protein
MVNGLLADGGKKMKNLIKNLSNTQKKILAGFISITMPIWILALPFLVLFGMIAILYTEIAYALGVEEDE